MRQTNKRQFESTIEIRKKNQTREKVKYSIQQKRHKDREIERQTGDNLKAFSEIRKSYFDQGNANSGWLDFAFHLLTDTVDELIWNDKDENICLSCRHLKISNCNLNGKASTQTFSLHLIFYVRLN